MTDQPTYPYGDGDVSVLGPQIFAGSDGAVICWRGENYVRQAGEGRCVCGGRGLAHHFHGYEHRPVDPSEALSAPRGAPDGPDGGAEGQKAGNGAQGASGGSGELTAEEARNLATELGIDLYRAQDRLAFIAECLDAADEDGITTLDVARVRRWLDGPKCGRQLAAEQPATLAALAAAVEFRDPCPYCESSPHLIPRHRMAAHIAEQHPEVRAGGPGIPVPDAEPELPESDPKETA